MSKPTTLYDKIWNDHLVHEADDGTCLLYIDRHLVHEVTSPQAFEGLRSTGRKVRAPEKTLAVVDHNIPTTDRSKPNPDPESNEQMRVSVDGKLPDGVTGKDIILAIIGEIGTAGGTGYVLEYAGDAIRALSMEGRMTVCNMSIEGGARAGLIAPDEKAFEFLKGRPKAPKGEAWDAAMRYWEALRSDEGAHFDHEIRLDAAKLPPIVTWRTSPDDVISVTGKVPKPADMADDA